MKYLTFLVFCHLLLALMFMLPGALPAWSLLIMETRRNKYNKEGPFSWEGRAGVGNTCLCHQPQHVRHSWKTSVKYQSIARITVEFSIKGHIVEFVAIKALKYIETQAFGGRSLPFLLTMAVILGGGQLLRSFRVCCFSHRMLTASERKPVSEN